MSGVNKLINSDNTLKGNSQDALNRKLLNANTVAKGIKEIPMKKSVKGKK